MTAPQPASAPPPDSATPSPPAAPLRSRRRLWTLRGLSVLLALTVMSGCEMLLRVYGVGDAGRLVVPVEFATDDYTHRFHPQVDHVYFGRVDMFGPEPRPFRLPKPQALVRIVFLGASTVNGFPYATEIAFPRQVEVLLAAQHPDRRVEVLNAGITAINSFEIADLARECLACQPDLVVVHTGHNEFYGPGGPGSTALALPPRLVPLAFAARRLRGVQLLTGWIDPGTAATAHPLQALPRTAEIRWQDDLYRQGAVNYRANLTATVQILRRRGVAVLLTTVASNLRHQGPIHDVWPLDVDAADRRRVEQTLTEAERLARNADWTAALTELDAARERTPGLARLQFRRGEALAALGRIDEAREAFRLARDYDGCRFRASGEFADIVRELHRASTDPELHFADVAEQVEHSGQDGIPGRDLFLEHVHYTLPGHRLIARLLARHILEEVWKRPWDAERDLSDDELDARVGILPEDALAGDTFALEVLQTPPLADGLDVERERVFLREQIRRRYLELSEVQQSAFADLSLKVIQTDLVGGLTAVQVLRGQFEAARRTATAGVAR